jgi:hypothetical protein
MRTLNPGPLGVLGGELGGILPVSGGLDGLMVGLRPHRQLGRRVFGPGAYLAGRARATGRGIETGAHDGVPGDIPARGPLDTTMPLRTVRLLRLPINHAAAEHHGTDEVRNTLKRSNFVGPLHSKG